jgi:phage shock protein A
MTTKRVTQHGAQSQTLSTVEPALVQTVVQTPMKRKASSNVSGLIEKKSKIASKYERLHQFFRKVERMEMNQLHLKVPMLLELQ